MRDITNKNVVTSTKKRVVFLDGIRGWASFVVLLSHLVACFLALATPQINVTKETLLSDITNGDAVHFLYGVAFRFLTDGHLAVLIFFVLSGYALSTTQLNPATRNLRIVAVSRYFRLMIPILFTSLIAYLFLETGLFFNLEAAMATETTLGWLGSFYKFDADLFDALKFSLYDVFFEYDDENTYNSSLWTMRTELYGSMFIYAYLAIFRKTHKVNWKVIGVMGILLYLFQTLYACFVAGYVIAELHKKYAGKPVAIYHRASQAALSLLVVVSIMLSVFFRENDQITFFIATALVFSVTFSLRLSAFFSTRLSEFLGEISFPLYLIQIVVICSWSSYLFITLPMLGLSVMSSLLINLLSTILICIAGSVCLIPVEKMSVVYAKRIGNFILQGFRPRVLPQT